MTALPSFVELMASLGLDNNKKSSLPPTQELSSPAIVVSSEHESTQDHISSRIRVARYSPYGAPISHSHRRSASTLSIDGTDSELPSRTNSASPRHRPCALKLGSESKHRHVNDPESSANMPISTFVRRRTPTSSPVSPTFAHRTRRRSQSPTINPVSLPTLPPVFVPHVQHRGEVSSVPSSDDEDSSVHRRAERLTPDYPFAKDRHTAISPFSGNGLTHDSTSRCVSPLA
ncbi:hypothetical protein BDM02DRAFT_3186126 [Thelephora ganbajun]|uniref:Uncharacterized protein n=1 Tax=Thelephora ganbajun TaxID=370292 RepID=A0ACB6ZJS5_THEGA|nr:hypothetical protein BDM02DRAFT_3186126 [Thelephora ganbajun]